MRPNCHIVRSTLPRDATTYMSTRRRYVPEDDPSQIHFTPEYILKPIRRLFGGRIHLDPCTTPENPCGAEEFFSPPEDGCAESWTGFGSVFCNPPYGDVKHRWVQKCITEAAAGVPIVLLIPAATDSKTFHIAASSADGVLFLKGRVKVPIYRENGRRIAWTHPSALYGWNVDLTKITDLGLAMRRQPDGFRF